LGPEALAEPELTMAARATHRPLAHIALRQAALVDIMMIK
jgi:hypothetical protein